MSKQTRDFVKTDVLIDLVAGPADGARIDAANLTGIKIILDNERRLAHAYINQNDGVYLYSPAQSEYLTRNYDRSRKVWGDTIFEIKTV